MKFVKELSRQSRLFDKTWKTQDGKVIQISEMTDQHLGNTIKWIERKREYNENEWMDHKHEVLKAEQKRRRKEGIMVRPQRKEDTLIFDDE